VSEGTTLAVAVVDRAFQTRDNHRGDVAWKGDLSNAI
jgi:hypothetical protein